MNPNLKKIVTIIVIFAPVFAVYYYLMFYRSTPCKVPIEYSIGTFDKRFGVSREYFLGALSEAERIWEQAIDKQLFVYDIEKKNLVVNLVYDYRQEVTKTLSNLGDTLEENESTYKAFQERYEKLKLEYNQSLGAYNIYLQTFNNISGVYESRVDLWNKSARNSKEQFEKLEDERMMLQAETVKLRDMERILNEFVVEINSLVIRLNSLGKTLNLSVEKYNTIGSSRGETFTGGSYHSDKGSREINIYEFSGRNKLIMILAHELGHALGLEHVEDPDAIMYYLNNGKTLSMSESDINMLKTLCVLE